MHEECVILCGRTKTGPGPVTEKVELLYEIVYAASCILRTLWAKERVPTTLLPTSHDDHHHDDRRPETAHNKHIYK